MSLLDDIVGLGMDTWFDTDLVAQTVTYKTVAIPAHFSRDEVLDGSGRSDHGTLEVRASDVPVPAYQDTVVIGTETWKVLKLISSDGYSHRIELYRGENPLRR
jgi:hypothetical protein